MFHNKVFTSLVVTDRELLSGVGKKIVRVEAGSKRSGEDSVWHGDRRMVPMFFYRKSGKEGKGTTKDTKKKADVP